MVIVGAGLSAVGGFLNAASIVLFGTGTTSVTGTVSSSAVAFVSAHPANSLALRGTNIFGAYLFGSFFCGLLIRNKAFHIRRRYGFVLMVEALFIFAAALLVHMFSHHAVRSDVLNWADFVAEALVACGAALQNSSFTTFSSAIVRTTHITGMVADAGTILGQVIWYRDLRNVWKLAVFGPLIGAFFVGSLLGGYAAVQLRHFSLYIASLLLLISSMAFIVMRLVMQRFVKSRKQRRTSNVEKQEVGGKRKKGSGNGSLPETLLAPLHCNRPQVEDTSMLLY
jgi:uncharacterized membrane protein YoaK (UPF0700 family)